MTFVFWSVALLLVAGPIGALVSRRAAAEFAYRACVSAALVLGAVPAVRVLAGGSVASRTLATPMPGGPWVFGLDALSALFLLIALGVGTAAAWFGVAYLHRGVTARAARTSHFFLSTLLAAVAALVVARAAVPFLIAWELMALASYGAIVLDHGQAGVRRAGLLYLAATHTGTLLLFVLFAAWGAGAPDLTFAALGGRTLDPAARAIVLGAALIAFGFKAGVVPLHFWLPEAHSAAPSHISAVMSGVVIKMGIYGLLRVSLLMGALPAWWGWALLALGGVSGVLGVVWALAQHDLKRLLAFHSVENIGIILLGIGVGALGVAYGHPAVAALGFAGAALHTMNHALFKSLLFLGAGSVAHATGTRELERMGGLARRMPVTALTFLIGSAAIVGLPPLNGFVSEWLIARSMLGAGLSASPARVAVLGVGVLGLIGALALACFAKVFGAVFLGRPRDASVVVAGESAAGITRPMAVLAAACVAVGLLPGVVTPPVLRAGALVAGHANPVVPAAASDPAAMAATWFTLGLAGALLLLWGVVRSGWARTPWAAATTWGCGYGLPTARMQYTASSFAAPLLGAYRGMTGVRVVRTDASLATHAADPVLDAVVTPGWNRLQEAARRIRPLHRGRLSIYLMYVVAALLAMLTYLMLAGRGA
ncbi:MAG: oxidoreductase [Gemmatimonadota bacterium]|nr:oxidoreductase [Gemmatimonadota bacterium]